MTKSFIKEHKFSAKIVDSYMESGRPIYTSLEAIPVSALSGMAVVPLEPTEEMIEAGWEAKTQPDMPPINDTIEITRVYKAMLAASEGSDYV